MMFSAIAMTGDARSAPAVSLDPLQSIRLFLRAHEWFPDHMTKTDTRSRGLRYARVSTYGQTLDARLEQLRRAGCAKVYREKASRARPDRRGLLRMLKGLTPATW
jgi:hypothetical protein